MGKEENVGVDPIQEFKKAQIAKLDERYKSIVKRLETETNIIIRYELKVSLEELLQVYKLLFN